MKWIEVTVVTTQEATEAVANFFHELGASGVVIEDPALVNLYKRSGQWDYCDIPDQPEGDVTVKAYLPSDPTQDQKLTDMRAYLDDLLTLGVDTGVASISSAEVREEDWANAWKTYYHTLKIGERLIIKPSWEEYQPNPGEIVLELDPGMAFGTGTHHTTTMCMEMLEKYLKPGMSVLDVGTGSGILSITAAKLGVKSVLAVDIDSVAVRVAEENIILNGMQEVVTVRHNNLLEGLQAPPADIVIANIIADVILKLTDDVPAFLKSDGLFLTSGIIEERLDEVVEKLQQRGFCIEHIQTAGGWCCVLARRG